MAEPEVVDAMKRVPALSAVSGRELRSFADQGRLRRYRASTYLYHQEDDSESVMLILEGRVELISSAPSGHRQWITTVDPPQLVGEVGVISRMPRTSSALALEETTVWLASADRFHDFIRNQPGFAYALCEALAKQVHAYGALVEDLLFLDLKGRVAKRLVTLVSPSLDEPADDGTVLPLITQSDLAGLCGGSRENVSRILSEFHKRGLIGKTGRRYTLKDVGGLVRLARSR